MRKAIFWVIFQLELLLNQINQAKDEVFFYFDIGTKRGIIHGSRLALLECWWFMH